MTLRTLGLRASRPARFRPALERLEDRLAPSVTVTTTADVVSATDGVTSLREAINFVNAGSVADNTINLPAGLYKIALSGSGENNNATGDFDIKHALILQGAGAAVSIVDGNGLDRVFDVSNPSTTSSAVTFSGLTTRGGFLLPDSGGGIFAFPANANTVAIVLDHVVVTGNHAGTGGGVFIDSNVVSATLTDTVISNNIADQFGGGLVVETKADILSSTVSGNAAGTWGGGIFTAGASPIQLKATTVTGNVALQDGGGVYNRGNGALTLLSQTVIAGNTARGQIADSGNGGGVYNYGTGPIQLTASTVTGNSAALDGGGIYNHSDAPIQLDAVSVIGNVATRDGGGIYSGGVGAVTVGSQSVIASNTAGRNGGGIILPNPLGGSISVGPGDAIRGNAATANGGGIFALAVFQINITSSSVTDNRAGGNGGGLDVGLASGSDSNFINVTIAGNFATNGTGIYRESTMGTLTLFNDTIAFNASFGAGSALVAAGSGSVSVKNTIVAKNRASLFSPDVSGSAVYLSDGGGNLIGNNSGAPGFAPGTPNGSGSFVGTGAVPLDPGLAPPADNGGTLLVDGTRPLTDALMPGSLALSHGMTTDAPTTDERGVPRPGGGAAPDIGAFQSAKVAFAISKANNQVNRNLFALDGKPLATWTAAAPGQFTAIASATFGPGSDIMLLGLGLDHQLYGARFKADGTLVFGWFLVAPGQFSGLIADTVGTAGAGSFPIAFGLGTDGQAYGARFTGEGTLASGWFLVAPGQFLSLTAGQFGAGNPELFGIGADHQVYGARFDTKGSFMNGWFLVAPGQFASASVTSKAGGGEELFAIGLDQRIYGAVLNAAGMLAAGWFPTSAGTFLQVSAVNLGLGTIGVYALGTDHRIYTSGFSSNTGTQNGPWSSPAPGFFSSLAAGVNLLGRGEVLGIGSFDGTIYAELFSSDDAFLNGFFTTGAGAFATAAFAP